MITSVLRILLICAVGGVAACATASSDPAGTFSRSHEVRYFDGEAWQQETVVDALVLSPVSPGVIDFELEITGENMHSCEMRGRAVNVGDSFEHRDELRDGTEVAGGPCLLRITPAGDTVVVEDIGSLCRTVWCGARASIGRTEFRR